MSRSAGVMLLGATACAAGPLSRRADEIETQVQAAAQGGAVLCAPEELALAQAHLEFARLELGEGNASRARGHLILAEPNAKAALRVIEEGKCEAAATIGSSSSFRPSGADGVSNATP